MFFEELPHFYSSFNNVGTDDPQQLQRWTNYPGFSGQDKSSRKSFALGVPAVGPPRQHNVKHMASKVSSQLRKQLAEQSWVY